MIYFVFFGLSTAGKVTEVENAERKNAGQNRRDTGAWVSGVDSAGAVGVGGTRA